MTLKHVFRLQSLMAVLTVSFMLSCCKTTGGNHHGQGPSAYSVIDGDSIIASYVMEFNADDDEIYGQTFRILSQESSFATIFPLLTVLTRNWRRPIISVGGLSESI